MFMISFHKQQLQKRCPSYYSISFCMVQSLLFCMPITQQDYIRLALAFNTKQKRKSKSVMNFRTINKKPKNAQRAHCLEVENT